MGLFGKKKEVTEIKLIHKGGLNGYGMARTKLWLDDENNCITMEAKRLATVHLKYEQIIDIVSTADSKITEKDKSVLGRALVGSALLGPVGAVVGGISGTGSTKATKTSFYMVISYRSNNGEIKELKFSLYGIPWTKFIRSVKDRIASKEVEEIQNKEYL